MSRERSLSDSKKRFSDELKEIIRKINLVGITKEEKISNKILFAKRLISLNLEDIDGCFKDYYNDETGLKKYTDLLMHYMHAKFILKDLELPEIEVSYKIKKLHKEIISKISPEGSELSGELLSRNPESLSNQEFLSDLRSSISSEIAEINMKMNNHDERDRYVEETRGLFDHIASSMKGYIRILTREAIDVVGS
jgi:pyoverdine/dityrosine biosynthesis protein Dit1